MPIDEVDIVMINKAVDEAAEGRRPTREIYAGTVVEKLLEVHAESTDWTLQTAMKIVPSLGAQKAKLALYLDMMERGATGELKQHLDLACNQLLRDGDLEWFNNQVWHRLSDEEREQINSINSGGSWASPEDI